jgi:hypothetical protein
LELDPIHSEYPSLLSEYDDDYCSSDDTVPLPTPNNCADYQQLLTFGSSSNLPILNEMATFSSEKPELDFSFPNVKEEKVKRIKNINYTLFYFISLF